MVLQRCHAQKRIGAVAMILKAPYPWFGGKSRIAAEVWRRLGDTPNYVEPFLGSAAMLLARPPSNGGRIETVNDYDAHVANFWRSVQADPEAVAHYAGNMVSELDLHARGDWLFYRPSVREWVEQLRADPGYYDAKSAGWWVWFVSCWIGSLPDMNRSAGRGVNRKLPPPRRRGPGRQSPTPPPRRRRPGRQAHDQRRAGGLHPRIGRTFRACAGVLRRLGAGGYSGGHDGTRPNRRIPRSAVLRRGTQQKSVQR